MGKVRVTKSELLVGSDVMMILIMVTVFPTFSMFMHRFGILKKPKPPPVLIWFDAFHIW